ncbi:hypothetical protein CRG98_012363 [Punica granatum]|uniref:Uncharacterized protein n=1 Tax=Punica granatum TaxID=22663 RepID=A0A2I0KFD5_PUNGR|nr:hypothetical protein CRG98_012363 [Punica granatum]
MGCKLDCLTSWSHGTQEEDFGIVDLEDQNLVMKRSIARQLRSLVHKNVIIARSSLLGWHRSASKHGEVLLGESRVRDDKLEAEQLIGSAPTSMRLLLHEVPPTSKSPPTTPSPLTCLVPLFDSLGYLRSLLPPLDIMVAPTYPISLSLSSSSYTL